MLKDTRSNGNGGGVSRSKIKRLTPQEEIALFLAYQAGNRATEAHSRPSKSAIALIVEGEKARREIIESHVPLVIAEAKKLHAKNRQHTAFGDLVGAGMEGLIIALGRFDTEKACRFSTYAIFWIRNRMSALIRQDRWVMRIPDHIYKQVLKLLRVVDHLAQESASQPTVASIAEAMAISCDEVSELFVWIDRETISLDIPVGEDGNSTLGDFVPEEKGLWWQRRANLLEQNDLRNALSWALRDLPIHEAQVLKLRFGWEIGEELETAEIAGRLGCTDDHVRKLQHLALRRLRRGDRSHRLRDWLASRGFIRPPKSPEALW